MKKIFLLITFLFIITIIQKNVYSQDNDTTKWDYFKIYATTDDDSLFLKVQDEMGIFPYLQAYTINVDIRSKNPKEQTLVLGVIDDPSSVKFSWSQFSEEVRNGLINWTQKNKVKLEE